MIRIRRGKPFVVFAGCMAALLTGCNRSGNAPSGFDPLQVLGQYVFANAGLAGMGGLSTNLANNPVHVTDVWEGSNGGGTPVAAQFLARDGVTTPPPTKALFVTDQTFDAVRVFDPIDHSLKTTIQLPAKGSPLGIAATPDGSYVWVVQGFGTSSDPYSEQSYIQIIDARSYQIVGSIHLPFLTVASWIAISPDGKTAYVTNEGSQVLDTSTQQTGAVNSILVIDVATQTVSGQIMPPVINAQLGPDREVFDHLAVSPDGSLLYAVCQSGICVYDTLTNAQVNPPQSALPLPDIDTFSVPGVIPSTDTPIIFHPNGTHAYFTSGCPAPNGGNVCLTVMDTKTSLIADSVTLGRAGTTEPAGLGISADGRNVAVKEYTSGDWIIIDTNTDKVVKHIPGELQTFTVFFRTY